MKEKEFVPVEFEEEENFNLECYSDEMQEWVKELIEDVKK